jgi:D-tyrosyl-tRNA(Tyr) deacylase
MRAVLQRVSRARVTVDDREVASMGAGLLVLLGAGGGDSDAETEWMVDKIVHLRVFPDDSGRMNRSLLNAGGEMIVVSQFTLYGDCRKGRRPSFAHALEPGEAERLVDLFASRVRDRGVSCGTGVFGAHMDVEMVNDGPVTLLIDSAVARRAKGQGFSDPPA